MVRTIRAIGKQIIKQVGKKVLSGILIGILKGDFNLNSIAFPIRAMIPKSALEKALQATCLFPLYINRAAETTDPVERVQISLQADEIHRSGHDWELLHQLFLLKTSQPYSW